MAPHGVKVSFGVNEKDDPIAQDNSGIFTGWITSFILKFFRVGTILLTIR
jgi:hypothetical protein